MNKVSGATGTRPWSSSMWSASSACTRPMRTTLRMPRSTSTSPGVTVARWNIDGVCSGWMRSTAPQASRRRNRSSVEVAWASAAIWSAWPPMASLKNSGAGCVVTRFTSHESRGTTH